MTTKQQAAISRAIVRATRDRLTVHAGAIRATGERIFAVRSTSEANRFHLLKIEGDRIRCDCLGAQQSICKHAAAVRLFLIEERERAMRASVAALVYGSPAERKADADWYRDDLTTHYPAPGFDGQ